MLKSFLKKGYYFFKKRTEGQPQRLYEIDGFILDMGERHMLSLIQKNCLMYDRFVPFLGELADLKLDRMKESDRGVIIDIGANVGDTVAGMVRHTGANVICVEPTKKFSILLEKNIANMGDAYAKRIRIVNAYIAQNSEENYKSEIIGGTAIKQKITADTEKEAPTLTIPELLSKIQILPETLTLVKIDTDGYDSECIMSFGEQLKSISPLLFWENQIDMDEQMYKFIDMVNYLSESGYTHFFLFDNFGNYMCRIDADSMKSINRYLGRILHKNSPRSFYYVDVLASKHEDRGICETVIKRYLKDFDDKGRS